MSYEKEFVKLTKKAGAKLGYSDTDIIFNGVYWFIMNLPYSIDFRNEKFVSGSFLHDEFDKDDVKIGTVIDCGNSIHECFVGVENDNVYSDRLIRNGNLLQVCYILQKMLMGELEVPNEMDDFVSYYKIRLTNDSSYNNKLFEMVKKLPEWCLVINSCGNFLERTEKLREIYGKLSEAIGYKCLSSDKKMSYLWSTDLDLHILIALQQVDVYLEPKVKTMLSYVQLLVSTIIPELRMVYNDLVLRGNQLHSVKLALIQILREKYGISDIDYSLLFEMIGLEFKRGFRKKDCLKLVRKKLI